MKDTYRHISLFFLGTLFFGVAQTVFGEDIRCPNAQQQFDCGPPTRAGQSTVKFEFIGQQQLNWTPISLVVSVSLPLGNNDKVTPVLDVVRPIQLYKQTNGDFVVVCKYVEAIKYGRAVRNDPVSTLTIKASDAKECRIANEDTVSCSR